MGFLNGLSLMGSNMAAFAGSAGLEQQKSDLAKQSMMLADQLATTRESAGRQEAGQIAATAAGKEQEFKASESTLQRGSTMDVAKLGASTSIATANIGAGATLGAAGISAGASRDVAGISAASAANVAGIGAASAANVAGIGATSAGNVATIQTTAQNYATDMQSKGLYAQLAQMDPVRKQEVLASQQRTALETVQTANAQDLRDANAVLAAEQAKDRPDPAKIAAAKAQTLALGYSATVEQARAQASAAIFRTDMDAVNHFNQQLVTATAELNKPGMEDTDRTAQKGVVANLQKQLDGAQAALKYSSELAHPGQGMAPPSPPGVPAGASYSPSLKMWRGPDGSLFDAQGKPATAPGQQAPTGGLMNNGFGGPH